MWNGNGNGNGKGGRMAGAFRSLAGCLPLMAGASWSYVT
jgi:hypothetical protein